MTSDNKTTSKYKAAVIKEKGGKFVIEERVIPTPGDEQVLIKVDACGVCHSDMYSVNGIMPVEFPRVPGHEVVGHVVAVGPSVKFPTVGMYVGVGWHGSHCLHCKSCRKGDFAMCSNEEISGFAFDGGYQQYMLAHWTGVAEIPEGLDPVEAAPLLCAGITMFNGIRRQKHIMPGDLVGIQGIGGLGHLGIQFANKMGYRVAAISSSDKKKELSEKLGAHHYINTSEKPASEQLKALGGAKLIVTTAPNAKAMADMVGGLAPDGRLLIAGADAGSFEISPLQLIPGRTHVCGWAAGTAADSSDTCEFAKLHGIKSMNEVYTIDQAQEAYDHMCNGSPRFRVVIKMSD